MERAESNVLTQNLNLSNKLTDMKLEKNTHQNTKNIQKTIKTFADLEKNSNINIDNIQEFPFPLTITAGK